MAVNPPAYADTQNSIIAYIQNNLVVTDQFGNRVIPNFSNGSVLLTFADVLALCMDSFYGQMVAVDAALRLASAQGPDLDALGALVGAVRQPGAYAQFPVKFTRNIITGDTIPIPVGTRVLARDQFGNASIEALTIQDFTLPLGTAGQIVGGAASGWAVVQATSVGIAGNIGAGQVAQLGATIAGVDTVSNPQVSSVITPVVTHAGTPGTTTREFGVVAHGLTGTTPVSRVTTTTGAASPNGTNYDIVTWTLTNDVGPGGYDVLLNTGTSGAPVWGLIANVGPSVTTANYQGAATTAYAGPTVNTTQQGVGGIDVEPDDGNPGFRQRIPTVLQSIAKSTQPAIISAVAAVSGVLRVFGVDDATPGVFDLYYVGSTYPLSTTQQAAIAAAYTAYKAAGIRVSPTQVQLTAVSVHYTYAPTPGTDAGYLVAPINSAINAYFASLNLGDPVRWSGVAQAISNVPGVGAVNSVVLNSQSANTDVAGVAGTLYGPPANYTVTIGS